MQSWDTVVKHPKPLLAVCRRVTPKNDQVTTLYTLWTTTSVTVARNSTVHVHSEAVRGGNFKHFKTSIDHTRY